MRLFFQKKYLVLLLLLSVSIIRGCPVYAEGKRYSIHIKTVNTAAQAEKIVAALSQKGYDAFYRHMPSFEEGIQYRIFVGTYPSKEQAIKTLNILWNSDISDRYAIAVLHQKSTPPEDKESPREAVAGKKSPQDQPARDEKETPVPNSSPPETTSDTPKTDTTAKLLGDALRYYHDNHFKQALERFKRISDTVENRDILFWSAICESKSGNYTQAAEKMTLFLAKEPNSPQGMLELAAILLRQNKNLEALEELEKAKAFQPPSEMLQYISRIKRMLLENENRFSLSLDFLIKEKNRNQSTEKSDPADQKRKPPREFYQIGSASENLLRSAQKIDPDNTAVSYYLGHIDLRNNQPEDGILEWEKYLRQSTENERTIHLRKQLTLLRIRHAARYSLRSPKNDRIKRHAGQNKGIVIAELHNRCFSLLPGMGQGVAAMLMDDLEKIDGLRIPDRTLVHAVSAVMQPDLTPVTDPVNAAKLGRHLSSDYTMWGEFTDISENAFQFFVTITDAHDSNQNGMTDIRGTREEFYILEKRMLFWILESIGIHKKDLPPNILFAIEKPQTRNFDAFLGYARGLALLDDQQFAQAQDAFREAIRLDPTFTLAERALYATPYDIYYCPFFEQSEIFMQENEEK